MLTAPQKALSLPQGTLAPPPQMKLAPPPQMKLAPPPQMKLAPPPQWELTAQQTTTAARHQTLSSCWPTGGQVSPESYFKVTVHLAEGAYHS
ncbi:hypothetical protein KUCAC02_035279 [Chaenocephalus aceratus]|nr:hypothetical protein KUCAC02_035279 [Chaenocephalus aceratus]